METKKDLHIITIIAITLQILFWFNLIGIIGFDYIINNSNIIRLSVLFTLINPILAIVCSIRSFFIEKNKAIAISLIIINLLIIIYFILVTLDSPFITLSD